MEAAAQQERDRAGEPAHAQHGGRLKIAVDLPALAPAAQQAQAKGENARRKKTGPADSRLGARLLTRALKREGIDLLGGNEQQRVMPAQAQFFRNSESRKEMSACSSACNGNFHRWFEGYILTLYEATGNAGAFCVW